jgi:restriction system protein
MAAPVIDISPVLKVFMPLIVVAVIVMVMNAFLGSGGRRRRRSRYWADAQLSSDLTDPIESETWPVHETVSSSERWSVENLQKLEWKRLEILTAQFFRTLGFNARMTRVGADGGVDVELRHAGQDSPVGYAQCKAWTTYKVGVKPIRELYGVMAAEHVQHGVFVTTSTYTEEAREFASGKDLELVDGATLIKFIQQLPEDKQQNLMETAFGGDFSTPTCPNCDVKMVSRMAHKGKDVGSTFWGCRNYPRCKQTFKMRN